jgi:ribulose-5-phosphate 4-epimerase/fuculose-1-phosphate aldolase
VADDVEELRRKVAISTRILAMEGLVKDHTGHVSARVPGADEMLIRCRGGEERGHLYTGKHHVRRVDFDGQGGDMDSEHARPFETPIHGELFRARPEVQCVIHAHPTYTLLCGITGLLLRPIFGAYDPGMLRLATEGVPVFPRSALISDKEIAAQMLGSMGTRDVLVLRGHGITVAGRSVEAATTMALRLEGFFKLTWMIASAGLTAPDISAEDLAGFSRGAPREGTGWQTLRGVENWVWDHYVERLTREVGLPED